MIKIKLFIPLVLLGLLGLYVISLTPPPTDPFLDKSNTYLIDPGPITPTISAHIKLAHAESQSRFKIGIFGNSRVLMIGADAFEYPKHSFFNFSISSESIHGTAIMLDRLYVLNKLPEITVIGLDNLNLQRDNTPISPFFWDRIKWITHNTLFALTKGQAPIRTIMRRIWRFAILEMIRLKVIFGPEMAQAGLYRLMKMEIPNYGALASSGFRPDGSFRNKGRQAKINPIPQPSSLIDQLLLSETLQQINKTTKGNSQVFIFETPIYPDSHLILNSDPLAHVIKTRKLWHQKCSEFKFICMDAPLIRGDTNNHWYDATHAPEGPWATFISEQLKDEQRAF